MSKWIDILDPFEKAFESHTRITPDDIEEFERLISIGKRLRKESWIIEAYIKESAENTDLTREERVQIEMHLCALHDYPWWSHEIAPQSFRQALAEEWIGNQVLLSEERKTYLHLFVERKLLSENEGDRDKTLVEELGRSRVLGEYKDGFITLYINNIKDIACTNNAPGLLGMPGLFPFVTVVRYVYLRELMHAYFERKENRGYQFDREHEEIYAEFGALLFLQGLVNAKLGDEEPPVNYATKEELDWAIRYAESKTGVLKCYARGAELFKQYGEDKELCKQMLHAFPKELENIRN